MIPFFSSLNSVDVAIFVLVVVVTLVGSVFVRRLLRLSFPYFFMGLIGLLIGLWIGGLVSVPLRSLSAPYGRWLSIIANALVTVAIFNIFLAQSRRLIDFATQLFGHRLSWDDLVHFNSDIVLDTSALIDGRIEKVSETGFIFGDLLVPRFVLLELQKIADSSDPQKRTKGRKGLEVLFNLQKNKGVRVEVIDGDSERETKQKEAVDQRLVKLAKHKKAWLLTLDYNLVRVAEIQKVRVLNLNELALALKPVLLPGETVMIEITQPGKESGQGVGYLSDGTMVVVERGIDLVGKTITGRVVRIFQTVAGQMIFVEPVDKVNRTRMNKE